MNSRKLTILADCLVLFGIILLGSGWNGSANVTGAFPFHSSSVQLTGGATGICALLGVPTLLIGLILMMISLVWTAFDEAQKRG